MRTILIVDDTPDVLSCLKLVLDRFGYDVMTAHDAESALSVIRGGPAVDLVITDYQMPGMNGLELAGLLKRIVPSVPVILLSAYPGGDLCRKAQALGIDEYMQKPVNLQAFRGLVERVIKPSVHM